MSGQNDTSPPGRFRRAVRAFRRWRRARPFWGGLLVLLGGVEILASERAPLPLMIHIGLQGLAGYLVPIVLVLCGVLLLFHSVQRLFYSLLAIVLALGSWITSNLGGFVLGMLLALVGGALAFAWQPGRRQQAAAGSGSPDTEPSPREEITSEPSRGSPQPEPKGRHTRSAGLALVMGHRAARDDRDDRGDRGDRDDRGDGDGSGGAARAAGEGREPGTTALLAVPLAPLALSVLAAVGSRGLLAGSVPAIPLAPLVPHRPPAASPSVSALPGPPPVPSPRPSPDPSPGSGSRSPGAGKHTARVPAAAVAADSFRLTARFAALSGITYDGVANVPTARGTEPMLKFTMRSLRLPAAAMTVTQASGASLVMAGSPMEFSGDVELYTTRLSGVLNGVRVTFTATSPPRNLPANITLTSVTADQPFAAADLMRAAGSQLSTG